MSKRFTAWFLVIGIAMALMPSMTLGVTLKVVDAGGTLGETPPYAIGTEFVCEFRIDAADLAAEGALVNGVSICVMFNPADVAVVNDPPFTVETYFPAGTTVFNNKSPEAGKLQLDMGLVGNGGAAINDGLIATVTFRQLSNTHPVLITFCGLNPTDPSPNTRFVKTTGFETFIPSVIDGDHSLPVGLSAFTARQTSAGILIHWRTESETNNLGFNLYRIADGEVARVNAQIIRGNGTTGTPHEYQFLDSEAPEQTRLQYFIEDVDLTGNREKSPVITARTLQSVGLMTWGSIKIRR